MDTKAQALKKLRKQNNSLDKKLTEENNAVMTDIVVYLRVSNISERNQETVRYDLLQMILLAQERGEDIKTVVGEDYKTFCDDIISALPQQSRKSRILDNLDTMLFGLIFLSIIKISSSIFKIIYNATTGQPVTYQVSISVGDLLAAIMILAIAFVIVYLIGKNSFVLRPEQSKIVRFSIGGLIGGILVALFLLTYQLGKLSLFSVNIFILCWFMLTAYGIHKLYERFSEK